MSGGGGIIIITGKNAGGQYGTAQTMTVTQAESAASAIAATSPPVGSALAQLLYDLNQAISDANS